MREETIVGLVLRNFGFVPTADQDRALRTFAAFLSDRDDRVLMLLRGSAGTGKTSLSGAIVRTLKLLKQRVVLLAPTGRAAKVFSLNSDTTASTIHRRIYRQQALGGAFALAPNMHTDTLFLVDESSMIANEGLGESVFGTGRLLDDLVQFVYSGRNCRLMLIGDKAQLPPVGEEESPALSAAFMEGYGLHVYESDLNEVLRQSQESGILYNATVIRQMITHDEDTQLPKIRFHGFADIICVPGDELIETLATSYSRVGMDETMVVTRSNKRANIYNQGIRAQVLWREEELTAGDWLMVVRNNYYWTEKDAAANRAGLAKDATSVAAQAAQSASAPLVTPASAPPSAASTAAYPGVNTARPTTADIATPSFIANGDRAVIQRVRNHRDLYGFHFVDLWLRFPDYDNYELQLTAITDSLATEAPALTREQNQRLFEEVMADNADVRTKPERYRKLKTDPYYNALQIKYAYAVTCHKAQGGQWAHVFVDQGYMTDDMLTPDYIHWLYTAFTRATEKLFLVNWPKNQTDNSDDSDDDKM